MEPVYPGLRRPVHAVRGAHLSVRSGEFLALLGPSGSGKSSLLYLLAGLRRPTGGKVRFLGREWPRNISDAAHLRRERLGFVFQEPFLIPYLTVRENAAIQISRQTDPGRLVHLADGLGISDLLDEMPGRLSAGEQQRAGVLRALVNGPTLVLADEPTAWLDHENGLQVMSLLVGHHGCSSLVVVTHDVSMVAKATRTLRIEDGRLMEEAPR